MAGLRVKATKRGYYAGVIRDPEGDPFYINSVADFSKNWMVRVDPPENVGPSSEEGVAEGEGGGEDTMEGSPRRGPGRPRKDT